MARAAWAAPTSATATASGRERRSRRDTRAGRIELAGSAARDPQAPQGLVLPRLPGAAAPVSCAGLSPGDRAKGPMAEKALAAVIHRAPRARDPAPQGR